MQKDYPRDGAEAGVGRKEQQGQNGARLPGVGPRMNSTPELS